ncbi:MAG: STAS domain-containing protein [Planctomycetes bacterium]|nr:STAS domain-containing protein [Planctomycetota bacterium]
MERTPQLKRDGVRIAISGDLNQVNAAALRTALLPLLSPPAALQLDLSGARELDGACLQVLLAAQKTIAGHGGDLVLSASSPRVQAVLEASGALRFLQPQGGTP